eukprot:gene6486-7985_t
MFNVSGVNASGAVSFAGGGHQEARGGSSINIWYIENLLAELDSPGEYFYDAADGSLYLSVIAPQLTSLVSIKHAVDVTLSGLTLRHAAPTFLRKYESLP